MENKENKPLEFDSTKRVKPEALERIKSEQEKENEKNERQSAKPGKAKIMGLEQQEVPTSPVTGVPSDTSGGQSRNVPQTEHKPNVPK